MEQAINYTKTYQEYKAELDGEIQRTAEGFVRIGYLLKVARDTNILAESGYSNVTEFAKAEYNIDKTQVSRFIHINDKFSKGGYSDSLEDHYKGFGYAKLTIMLQLPEAINEEITPDYSKAEIQDIKAELDAEREISDIEVLMEGEAETTAHIDDDLAKVIKQLGEDDAALYKEIYTGLREPGWSMQEALAPAGQKIYSIRIRGIGRKQMMVKDKDNGNEVVLIDLRTNEKKRYTWEELKKAWESITEGEDGYRASWEAIYFASWPLEEPKKTAIAPVQPLKSEKKLAPKKESKVQKAPEQKTIEWESTYRPGDIVIDTISTVVGELVEKTDKNKIWKFLPTAPEGKAYNLSEDCFGARREEEPTEEKTAAVEENEEEQIPGQTSIVEDFSECMPSPVQGKKRNNQNEQVQAKPGPDQEQTEKAKKPELSHFEASKRRKTYMHMLKDFAGEVVRFAEMEIYDGARSKIKELENCLKELERLPKERR